MAVNLKRYRVYPELKEAVDGHTLMAIPFPGLAPEYRRAIMKSLGVAYVRAFKQVWPVATGKSRRGLYFRIGGPGSSGPFGGNTLFIKNKQDYAKYVMHLYVDYHSVVRGVALGGIVAAAQKMASDIREVDLFRTAIHRRAELVKAVVQQDWETVYRLGKPFRKVRRIEGKIRTYGRVIQAAKDGNYDLLKEWGLRNVPRSGTVRKCTEKGSSFRTSTG